jgi:predicted O-methyltransferase YrrM
VSSRGVSIGDDVWIGANAAVVDGCRIGAHSVVAAGAVVTRDFPEYQIIAGNPARSVRDRRDGPARQPTEPASDSAESAAAPSERKVRSLLFERDPYVGLEQLRPEDMQGWGSDHAVFRRVLSEVRPSLIVEVGSWKGASAIHMADLVKELGLPAEIVCIDTWLGNWQHWTRKSGPGSRDDLRLMNGFPMLYFQFLSNVVHRKADGIITPFPITSIAAVNLFRNYRLAPEVIYIDGDHEYESVILDLRAWLPLLAPGGVLIGDDFGWPGVRRAAEEVVSEGKWAAEIDGNKFVMRARSG